jgi:hypothetical protein
LFSWENHLRLDIKQLSTEENLLFSHLEQWGEHPITNNERLKFPTLAPHILCDLQAAKYRHLHQIQDESENDGTHQHAA